MKKFFKRRQRRIMFGVLSCMGIAAVALPSHALAIDTDTKIAVGSALGAGAVAAHAVLGYDVYKSYQDSKVSARSGSSSQGDGYDGLDQLPAIKSPPVPTASDSGINYSNTRNMEIALENSHSIAKSQLQEKQQNAVKDLQNEHETAQGDLELGIAQSNLASSSRNLSSEEEALEEKMSRLKMAMLKEQQAKEMNDLLEEHANESAALDAQQEQERNNLPEDE